ncbi:MAG: fructosamine kinase family protein [Myxococcota bacterium]
MAFRTCSRSASAAAPVSSRRSGSATISEALLAAAARRLGSAPRGARRLAGGDIGDVRALSLADGRTVVVKTQPGAPPELFRAEARGLAFLAEPAALRTPRVLAVDDAFLVLEYLAPAPRRPDFDERLGAGLAALHRSSPGPKPGLDHDNFLGPIPQANASTDDWASFYGERRLVPLAARAAVTLGATRVARIERLARSLERRVGPREPPSRLHGDLWAGNLLVDEQGAPALIDPAVFAGHREVDLSMMKLFGGFGPRVFQAYDAAYPRAPGHDERVPLYQLLPLLVHVALFGASYLRGVDGALDALGA